MDTIIEIKNIVKSYSNKNNERNIVLQGVSAIIERGKIVALVGPSGVGKSTLLHIVGTLDIPDKGDVIYNLNGASLKLSNLKEKEIDEFRNKKIGFIFQFHYLLPEFTALENVMLPKLIAKEKVNDARIRALQLLELTGVAHRQHHKPAELSGGEQQRIAIARALINNPEIVLADEPTGNLDAANSQSFISLLKQIQNEYKTTFVIATHSPEIASIADIVLNMKNGQII